MWIGVLWAGLRVAMWITHAGGTFRHGLLEKSLIKIDLMFTIHYLNSRANGTRIAPITFTYSLQSRKYREGRN